MYFYAETRFVRYVFTHFIFNDCTPKFAVVNSSVVRLPRGDSCSCHGLRLVHIGAGSFHNWHCLDGPLLHSALRLQHMSRMPDADRPPAYTCQGVTYTLRGSSPTVVMATTAARILARFGSLPLCFGFSDALELAA